MTDGMGQGTVDSVERVRFLLQVGQLDRAKDMAGQLIAADPQNAEAHQMMALVLMQLKRIDDAVEAARFAVGLAPDSSSVHHILGVTLFARGSFADAERSLVVAISYEPGFAPYLEDYARLLTVTQRFRDALAVIEDALVLDPDDADLHSLRALVLLRVNPRHWSISEDSVRRSLKLDPEDADAQALLGMIQVRAGQLSEAEEQFRRALHLDPANRTAMNGLAYTMTGAFVLLRPLLWFHRMLEQGGQAYALAIIFGLWAVVQGVSALLAGVQGAESIRQIIQVVYLALCAYTWFAGPAARWALSLRHPWIKQLRMD